MGELNNTFVVPPINRGENCLHNRIVRKQFQNTYYEHQHPYSLRNNVEAVFSSLKKIPLKRINSKQCMSKKREVIIKIIIYNLKKYLAYYFDN
ncbi:MAG: hypothetical protein ACLFPL_02270 [Candidatus Nanoarchaeia archaeon]